MTIAIVDLVTGQFLHTKPNGEMIRDSNGVMRPRSFDKDEGWYEFISASNQPPAGQKAQGTTFAVDHDAGTVTESNLFVDMTPEEVKQANNGPLDAQITALEVQNLYNRGSRTIDLSAMEKEAARQLYGYENVTLGDGTTRIQDKTLTPEQTAEIQAALYAGNPGYKRVKDLDDQIAALRAQRI